MAVAAPRPLPLGSNLQRLYSARWMTSWVMEMDTIKGHTPFIVTRWRDSYLPPTVRGRTLQHFDVPQGELKLKENKKTISSLEIILKKRKYRFVFSLYKTLRAQSSYADSLSLWCLLWVVHPQPMSQRAAAARGAAAPLPPSLPLTRPLCLDTLTPPHLPSVTPRTPSMKLPLLLPCHPRLPGLPRLCRPQHPCPPATMRGRSAVYAASSGNRSQRRRSAGSPTSGRWRCGSSSTRSTSALWRSCSGSRRRQWQAYVGWLRPLEPQPVSPGPGPLKRAAKMRWVFISLLEHWHLKLWEICYDFNNGAVSDWGQYIQHIRPE